MQICSAVIGGHKSVGKRDEINKSVEPETVESSREVAAARKQAEMFIVTRASSLISPFSI